MSDEIEPPAPLRADALRMLADWRDADVMPGAVKRRVWMKLRPRPRQRSARVGWIPTLAVAAAVVLLLIAVSLLGSRTLLEDPRLEIEQAVDGSTPTVPTGEMVPRPRAVADRVEADRVEATLPPIEPSSEPQVAKRSTPRRPAKPVTPSVAESDSRLARERELIARAWQAVEDWENAQALEQTSIHAREFGRGVLVPEREAIAVIAHCQQGDDTAQGLASAWLARHPRSPLAARVRSACSPSDR